MAPAPWVNFGDNVRPVGAKALICNQHQLIINLLPLQGEYHRVTLPRVPASLCAASALGYGLVGLSGHRCRTFSSNKCLSQTWPQTIIQDYPINNLLTLASTFKTQIYSRKHCGSATLNASLQSRKSGAMAHGWKPAMPQPMGVT